MIAARLEEFHGPPDLTLAGFRLWVHWLERDEDQIEGDWLVISACCELGEAEAWFEEMPVLQLSELRAWLQACETLSEHLEGEAMLACQEPNLAINAKRSHDGLTISVSITPDHRSNRQDFPFSIEPDELPAFLEQGQKLLAFFPLTEATGDGR